MGFQIMGTAHLGVPYQARCVCETISRDSCPFHQDVVRVTYEDR